MKMELDKNFAKACPLKEPSDSGWFGDFGGRFVSETLMTALLELQEAYDAVRFDETFWQELEGYFREYCGRPTPLTRADRLSEYAGGATIWLKREDLNHTGSHKLNNVLGQLLLARSMGKKRVVAETGAGQHGVATATICALFGMDCVVYMGAEDVARQALNVYRMRLLGAEVKSVESGSKTLKDATTEALRDWVATVDDTYYCIGSVVGPHPYPMMVRDFQSVISREIQEQLSGPPNLVVACVGGGSNAAGAFSCFIEDKEVELIGVEAAGMSAKEDEHCCSLGKGQSGILHGAKTYLLQTLSGQVAKTHSISAGLDYPGVGPEHSYWKDSERVRYVGVTDEEALEAFALLSRLEGIIPALESAHAVAWCLKEAKERPPEEQIVLCVSGRGDKDVAQVRQRQLDEEVER